MALLIFDVLLLLTKGLKKSEDVALLLLQVTDKHCRWLILSELEDTLPYPSRRAVGRQFSPSVFPLKARQVNLDTA